MRWWATLEWRFSVFPPHQQREKQPMGRRLLHVASLLLLSLWTEEHLCALCRKGGKRLEQVHPEGAVCVTTWSSVTRFNQPIDKKKIGKRKLYLYWTFFLIIIWAVWQLCTEHLYCIRYSNLPNTKNTRKMWESSIKHYTISLSI